MEHFLHTTFPGLSSRKTVLNHWPSFMFTINHRFWGHRAQLNRESFVCNRWYTWVRITLLAYVIIGLTCISIWYGSYMETRYMCPECQHSAWSQERLSDSCRRKLNESPFYKWVNWDPERWEMTCPSLHNSSEIDWGKLWNLFCPTLKPTFCSILHFALSTH